MTVPDAHESSRTPSAVDRVAVPRGPGAPSPESFPTLLATFAGDESSAARPPALRAEARRLHGCRGGVVSVLFILLGLIFLCSGALVWNTGNAVAGKMHAQMAADTAAFSAAQWNARCVNNIVGTNLLILRQAAAVSNAIAVFKTLICVPDNWNEKAQDAYDLCCAACLIACAACGAACEAAVWIYIIAVELAPYLSFLFKALFPAVTELFDSFSDFGTLKDYEKAWVEAVPGAIDADRKKIEEFYGVKIRLTTPGVGAVGAGNELSGGISPPLEESSIISMIKIAIPLAIRFKKVDRGWPDDSWEFPLIVLGEAKDCWEDSMAASVATGSAFAAIFGGWYSIPTANGFLETGPRSLDEWEDFQVVALAIEEDASKDHRVAPGLFKYPFAPDDKTMAVSVGETYHGVDGRLARLPGPLDAILGVYPWRTWTTLGWQWQPRLARASADGNDSGPLVRALNYDSELKNLMKGVTNPSGLSSVPMH